MMSGPVDRLLRDRIHPMLDEVFLTSSNRRVTMDARSAEASFAKTGCQLDELLKFLAQEWMTHIVWTLAREDTIRFGALRRALPGAISARVLSLRLKTLEARTASSRAPISAPSPSMSNTA
jgi:DNA-binding HxlR family transcriptional regulator